MVGVGWTLDGVTRLERCSFAVQSGEVFGVVGGTGSGKTSVLEVAAGLAAVTRGRILLDGQEVSRKPGRLRSAAALATPKRPGPDDLDVRSWLKLWARLDGVSNADFEGRFERAIAGLGLEGHLERPVATLSNGETTLLSIARIWIRRPKLYLLDDPAVYLDGDGMRRLTAMVRSVVAGGSTVVVASAAPHFVSSLCDRVACLKGGTVQTELRRRESGFQASVAAAQGWSA